MRATDLLTIALLVALPAACSKSEEPAQKPAEPAQGASGGAAQAPDAEEQQMLDQVPTMEAANAAATKEISDGNADAVLKEIEKELGGGN